MLSSEKKETKGKRTIYFLITVVNDTAGSLFSSDDHLSLRELQMCPNDNFITISILSTRKENLLHMLISLAVKQQRTLVIRKKLLWFDLAIGGEYTR